MKATVFRDRVKIFVRAGNGGDGICSFRREKFVPKGGPDGGDGGHGGNVILRGNMDEDSLNTLHHHPHQRAAHGGHGKGSNRTGKTGADKILNVPCGTVVLDPDTEEFIGEILVHGEEMMIAKGGRGGLGNTHFKSSVTQAPTRCTPGTAGEERAYRLELKLMTDVGLVGYPNAGKSTLLTALTDARPKIAAYPFTTLNPIIGTLIFENFNRIRIADIPGLIDGASEGVGLGHYFLRHIERSKFLLFVIDMAAADGRDPVDDYNNLRAELIAYNPDLAARPFHVLANKMDEPAAAENFKIFKQCTGTAVFPISAGLNKGLDEIKELLYRHFFSK
ncbi:MAG: GTPase ObgE [Kiritimatiellales bacterium]